MTWEKVCVTSYHRAQVTATAFTSIERSQTVNHTFTVWTIESPIIVAALWDTDLIETLVDVHQLIKYLVEVSRSSAFATNELRS